MLKPKLSQKQPQKQTITLGESLTSKRTLEKVFKMVLEVFKLNFDFNF